MPIFTAYIAKKPKGQLGTLAGQFMLYRTNPTNNLPPLAAPQGFTAATRWGIRYGR